MNKLSLISIIFFIQINLFAQDLIPIINLHYNDSLGVTLLNNQTVKISGIITAAKHFGANGPAFIQDVTGGVSVYGSRLTNYVQIGDSVTLTSKVVNYNGLTQIDFSTGTFTKHSSGNAVEPMLVTIDMIKNQAWNGLEELEGRLVRLSNVKINANGNFAGNTNYTITDSINTMDMRIDADVTSIVGTVIPSAKVDIIGIVGQYKSSAPYNSGYQLMPRSIDDIITLNVPVIISPVVISNITENSFTVFYNTVREGNSEIRWGKTTALELGVITKPDMTKEHTLTVENLQTNTRYYFKVYSTNQYGTSESTLQTVIPATITPSSGKINVYFNSSVDNTVAIPGNNALGNVDFKSKIINRINNANYSIDITLYSFFGMDDIANAIIAAKNRGVKVRVVYDNRTTQSSMQLLINAGIKVIKRTSGLNGIMHNKFAIFDGRDLNPENDWVWTGSFNWTSTELTWKNSSLEINDHNLADAYTKEFEEMWGSNTDEPNPTNAKFGVQKTDNTPHSFTINGIPVKLYFSPSDNTEDYIKNAILTSDSSLYFSLYVFTSDNLYNAISYRYQSGLRDIRGIIDDVNVTGSEYPKLLNIAEMFDFNLGTTLHHKYGIVDASYITSNPTVIVGSHNWSRAANVDNDENTLIINDIYIANQYLQEFKKRYNELGGVTSFTVPIISGIKNNDDYYPKTIQLNQNYPNPFNPITTITFFNPLEQKVTLNVYNLLGEKVVTLFDGISKAGLNVFDFNAQNLSSGIYFYKLTAGSFTDTKKCILLK